MNFKKRTHSCGELRKEDAGKKVVLNGWVAVARDLGGLFFLDLRDRKGITQVAVEPETQKELYERARQLKSEYVIWVEGTVRERSNPNPNIPTGLIEIYPDDFGIISKSELPPFEISDDVELSEEIKLRYRFLDLRRPKLQRMMALRNAVYQSTHRFFAENDFIEIETPYFMKSTPEGARDFLVPSRINKGKFYALPQSPQLYKQILMISGYERYVQIVKCFRDEDLRSDRQPEFTQVDLEMSFVDQEDVIETTENYFKRLWKDIKGVDILTPFRRMTYYEAMTRFGSDKPDLRFGWELKDISELVKDSNFKVFSGAVAGGGRVAALNAVGCAKYSRKNIDELTEFAKKYGAKGLAWMKIQDGEVKSPIAKFFDEATLNKIVEVTEAREGDLLLFGSDKFRVCFTTLGALRLHVARKEGLLDDKKDIFEMCWVTDFPLTEYDEDLGRQVAMHHPFTSPNDEDMDLLESDPTKVRAKAYDVVVNGAEVGGGSVRIHDPEMQKKMFKAIGLSEEEAESKFGFLLQALKFGAPPHGGIAFGLDRLTMTLGGTENIRDVIAFPKTTSGLSLMDGSPSYVAEDQLKELGIELIKKPEEDIRS